ncbi:hypothetical protein HK101_004725 [Irineochytrium annulatum]|nr:hypothetical protein HK101_004725 [Irineochytrium annulatum]
MVTLDLSKHQEHHLLPSPSPSPPPVGPFVNAPSSSSAHSDDVGLVRRGSDPAMPFHDPAIISMGPIIAPVSPSLSSLSSEPMYHREAIPFHEPFHHQQPMQMQQPPVFDGFQSPPQMPIHMAHFAQQQQPEGMYLGGGEGTQMPDQAGFPESGVIGEDAQFFPAPPVFYGNPRFDPYTPQQFYPDFIAQQQQDEHFMMMAMMQQQHHHQMMMASQFAGMEQQPGMYQGSEGSECEYEGEQQQIGPHGHYDPHGGMVIKPPAPVMPLAPSGAPMIRRASRPPVTLKDPITGEIRMIFTSIQMHV